MVNLEQELQLLRKRLVRIENTLNLPPINETPAPAAQAPVKTAPKIVSRPAQPTAPRAEGNFLGAIAVICFVLAAVFMIQLAISNGWLTPVRQLAIIFLAGFAFIGSALWLREKDSEYSGYLAAAGVITLYFGSYGGNLYFHLIEQPLTILLVGAIGLYNLNLYKKFESNLFLITASAGVFLGPILLGRFGDDIALVCIYNVIWSIVFSLISIKIESRLLSALAAYFAFGTIGLISATNSVAGNGYATLLAAQTLQFIIFTVAIVRHTLTHERPLSESEAMAYFPVLLVFYASEYSLLNRLMPEAAPWVSMTFGLLLIGASLSAKSRLQADHLPSSQLVSGFAALTLFHSLYLEILGDTAKLFLVPVILMSVIFIRPKNTNSKSWIIPKIAVFIILAIEGQKVFWKMLGDPDGSIRIVAALSAILLLLWPLNRRDEQNSKSDNWYFVLGTGHILAMQSLYRLVREQGSVAVSIAWGVYAIAILIFGFGRRDAQFARSATVILLFATAKVFLHDLSSTTAIVRIICLAITGAVLYLSGFLFRRIAEMTRD